MDLNFVEDQVVLSFFLVKVGDAGDAVDKRWQNQLQKKVRKYKETDTHTPVALLSITIPIFIK